MFIPPLSRNGFKDLMQQYVRSLPVQRRKKLPFTDEKRCDGFDCTFLKRHKDLTLKRPSNVEKPRQMAMSPTNLARHYACLRQIYKAFKIQSWKEVFNIDESRFSTRTATRSRAKALFDNNGRSHSLELKWASNSQHVTNMSVVSADGRA